MLFDVTGSLPRNAVVTAAKLSIFVSNVRPDRPSLSLESPVTVHELLAPWGSAGSDAVQQEGAGTRAMAGDATWTDRFLGGESWLTPGGDFELNPAALAILGEASLFYELASDAMVDDVNHWLSSPESNHGWILVGDESTHSTARRLNSANNPFAATRPTLTLEFHTAPLPEPRTVLLLAVSVGIHLIRRRKPDSRT